ncbi:MAG: gamma-glutamyltransferase [Gemmatimonadaceae bacterium]
MSRLLFARILVAALTAGAVACGKAAAPPTDVVSSTTGVVVSAHHLASDIGAATLAKGGNAVDAAIATAFGLAVTYPAAGNIGGGGFMIIRLADGSATTIDYREKAPLAATATMYLNKNGTRNEAATDSGWRAPGVPGTVAGLAMAHAKHGSLAWRDLVTPSAELAERGFPLSAALADELNWVIKSIFAPFPTSVAAYGKSDGSAWKAGDTLKLPQLARALRAIADSGPAAFYTGWIADSIAAQMRTNRGLITKADLAKYAAVERAPVRGTFNGHEIIGMAPPSSGGTVMISVLNQLEAGGLDGLTRTSARYLHRRAEASRRAFLERARWLGDPDFNDSIPLTRLLSKEYAASLVAATDSSKATSSLTLGADIVTDRGESMQTTHFSVVDGEGNAVSNTYTLESGYGSGVVVAGFLLNNEMGDFNKKPGYTNTGWAIGTAANVIVPEKRMLSSMSPTIVTKDGELRLVTGSPGGRTIPNTTLDVVLGVTLFGESIRAAVDAPRVHHQWMPDTLHLESGAASAEVVSALRAMGHAVKEQPARSQGDAHSIVFDAKTRTATAANDKRSSDSGARARP